MKKLVLIFAIMLARLGAYGQNVYQYPIYANGGLRVGENGMLLELVKNLASNAYDVVVGEADDSVMCDYVCDGTNDHVQIQEAIDSAESLGGYRSVLILPGTYNIGVTQSSRILKKKNVSIYGYGAYFELDDNLNDSIPNIFECEQGDHHYTGIYGVTINGSCTNNTLNGVLPVGGTGIRLQEWTYPADNHVLREADNVTYVVGMANDVVIQDVYIDSCFRDAMIITGTGSKIMNAIIGMSKYDHGIYISSGRDIYFNNITVKESPGQSFSIAPGSQALSDYQQVSNIIIDGLTTTCEFYSRGTVQDFGITGASDDYIKNIIIRNWIVLGDSARVNSNRHQLIKAKYVEGLDAEVQMFKYGHGGQKEFFYFDNCKNIRVRFNADLELTGTYEKTSVFTVLNSDYLDFSHSYVEAQDDKIETFLRLGGDVNGVNLGNSIFLSDNSNLIDIDTVTGEAAAGNHYNISIDGTIFSGDTICADSSAVLIYSGEVATTDSLHTSNGMILFGSGSVGAYCSQYQIVYNLFSTTPPDSIAGFQNTFVKTLVDSGVWAKLDVLYILANNNSDNALINWIDPGTFNGTKVETGGALTFTAYEGFKGTATTSERYIRTNYNPSTDATNYALNSASMGVYVRDSIIDGIFDIGCNDGTYYAFNTVNYNNGAYIRINNGLTSDNTASDYVKGMFIFTRTSSSSQIIYRNSSVLLNGTTTATGVPNAEIYTLCYNNNGTPANFSYRTTSMIEIGAGLSATDVRVLTNAFETYMDAIGKGVIP